MKHGVSAYAHNRCRCDVCRAAWTAYTTGYYRRQRQAGRCVKCKDTAEPGRPLCAWHRTYERQQRPAARGVHELSPTP
jgi:hypothetical protein